MRLISCLALLLVITSCDGPSYKASSASVIPVGEKGASSRYGTPLFLIVEPYADPERQKAVFDANFAESGILAIQLQVRNTTSQAVQVQSENMTLTLPGGHRLSPMSGHTAANLVDEKAGTGYTVGDFFSEALHEMTYGGLGGTNRTRGHRRAADSRAKRIADYEAKAFKNANLDPGGATSGFVFFRPPPGTPPFDVADLNIQFRPATGAVDKIVSQPVKGLAFKGNEADHTAATYVPRSQRGFKRCGTAEIGARPWVGNWTAREGRANMFVEISNDAVTGKITTPTHVYGVSGLVDGNGAIMADIVYEGTGEKAKLSGNFPRLRTEIDSTRLGAFWPLNDLIFRLCT